MPLELMRVSETDVSLAITQEASRRLAGDVAEGLLRTLAIQEESSNRLAAESLIKYPCCSTLLCSTSAFRGNRE